MFPLSSTLSIRRHGLRSGRRVGTAIEHLLLGYVRCPMPTLPFAIAAVIGAFAPVFSRRAFAHAKLLMVGAILALGKRTITSVLRVMERSDDKQFQNSHRLLNRARWLPLDASHRLLGLLLDAFVPDYLKDFG